MIFIGIDPGLSGALCAIYTNLEPVRIQVWDTPVALTGKKGKRDYLIADMATLVFENCKDECESFCVIESVHSMPGQGVSSSFAFGRGLGIWEGIVASFRIPYAKVAPQTWKKALLGDMDRGNKDSSRIVASRLFPDDAKLFSRKKDDGRADATLMAEYGRRLKDGMR